MRNRNSKLWVIIALVATPLVLSTAFLSIWRHGTLPKAVPGNLRGPLPGSGESPGSSERPTSTRLSAPFTKAEIPTGKKSVVTSKQAGSPAAAPACFEVTYHHKPLASHSSDDDCSHHRNLIRLPRADANLAGVCIRVRGIPVRHQLVAGTTDQFVLGPVAGPHDLITARFCVGKARCDEGCPYPARDPVKHDQFLDAIGADDDADAPLGQWEATDASDNEAVGKALEAADGEMRKEIEETHPAAETGHDAGSRLAVFKDWLGDPERPACAGKASATGIPSQHPLAEAQ